MGWGFSEPGDPEFRDTPDDPPDSVIDRQIEEGAWCGAVDHLGHGGVCLQPPDHAGPHKSFRGDWPQIRKVAS